jgi:D-cysteine desulfhydrase family pyridoxal phosphate-dependent enzyme
MDRIASLREKIGSFKRIPLAHLPTPLERLDNLSGRYGVNLFVKRDDQTGLAFGGNKTRKLEFIMADAVDQGADSIVTWAGIQSNWCRQTAAAAAKLGMKSFLVLFRRPHNAGHYDGNLLLDYLFDSEIVTVDVEKDTKTMMLMEVEDHIEAAAEKLRATGSIPYIAPIGGSIPEGSMIEPWGAIGYVVAMLEIAEQATDMGISFDSIVHATGSGATQAGLLAGSVILTPETRVIGICVSDDEATMSGYVKIIADKTFQLLGYDRETTEEDLIVKDDYLMEGYGIFNDHVGRALNLMARQEGLLLDPVYTGKAMTGLLDMLEKGVLKEGENILLLHSGGTPALFPYREEIVGNLPKER